MGPGHVLQRLSPPGYGLDTPTNELRGWGDAESVDGIMCN